MELKDYVGRRVRRLDKREGWRKARAGFEDVGTVNMTSTANRRSPGRTGGQIHVVWDASRCSWIAPDRVEIVTDGT